MSQQRYEKYPVQKKQHVPKSLPRSGGGFWATGTSVPKAVLVLKLVIKGGEAKERVEKGWTGHVASN